MEIRLCYTVPQEISVRVRGKELFAPPSIPLSPKVLPAPAKID